jgi:hypothetical protein
MKTPTWQALRPLSASIGILHRMWRYCVLPASLAVLLPGAAAAQQSSTYNQGNDIPPRLQWEANQGYCGEVSFISAGLYYGQYVSQYDARALASPGVPQYLPTSQLLIGVNDQKAAAAMHLNAVEWDTASETSSASFLAWVKRNVSAGYPVVIGAFNNEYLLYGRTDPWAGDPEYDHIVPVFGVGSNHPLPNYTYHADDTLSFSDNGLWTVDHIPPSGFWTMDDIPLYVFTYAFGPFQQTRQQANAPDGTVYALKRGRDNYGIAITGVMDRDHVTLPVRVATSVNYEDPPVARHSNARPAAMPLTLTVTVSHLTPGISYNLYRYANFSVVPNDRFNARASSATKAWAINIASGSSYSVTESIMSDKMAIYRAVPARAP